MQVNSQNREVRSCDTAKLTDDAETKFDYHNTEGFKWIKRKLSQGVESEFILNGFNSLYEFKKKEFSIDGENPLDEFVLSLWSKEINGELSPDDVKNAIEDRLIAEESKREESRGPVLDLNEWVIKSKAFQWLVSKIEQGLSYGGIIDEFNRKHLENPTDFSIWTGYEISYEDLEKINDILKQRLRELRLAKEQEKLREKQELGRKQTFVLLAKTIEKIIQTEMPFNHEQDFYITFENKSIEIIDKCKKNHQ